MISKTLILGGLRNSEKVMDKFRSKVNTSIPRLLKPIIQSLHLNMKLSKSVVGSFCFRALVRWMRSAFLASRSGLCILCMCSRSLSFLWPKKKGEKNELEVL